LTEKGNQQRLPMANTCIILHNPMEKEKPWVLHVTKLYKIYV
jgi:hypothetical protein